MLSGVATNLLPKKYRPVAQPVEVTVAFVRRATASVYAPDYSISKVQAFTRPSPSGVVRLKRGWVNPSCCSVSPRCRVYATCLNEMQGRAPKGIVQLGARVLPSRSPFGVRSLGGPSSPGSVLGRSGPWLMRSSGPSGPLSMESTAQCLLTFTSYHITGRMSRTFSCRSEYF